MDTSLLAVSYYLFGKKVVEKAREILLSKRDPVEAVVEGIKVIEEDPSIDSVGIGGIPNIDGELELDAAIMDGKTLRCGAVAAVKKVKHPISLAKRVMDYTPHVMIVGEGALKLAKLVREEILDTPAEESYVKFLQKRKRAKRKKSNSSIFDEIKEATGISELHDTIGAIAAVGKWFVAGTSTSGLACKFPGRVGDSPIIGAGLYADNDLGAAICTGFGEAIIRVVAAKSALDLIGEGCTAEEAVVEVVRKVNKLAEKEKIPYRLGIVAVDKDLTIAAAANFKFKYVYWTSEEDEIVLSEAILIKSTD
ncbi:MAG TPA: glycosylasparaginase [Thermoprotei archaeon]|nr:MAG: glycosylasparaginase [Thermoprotei archaeon]HDI75186.1 glycosylasparaginase [Thermoprotei archaeon]